VLPQPQQTQAQAIGGNLANLGSLYGLASGITGNQNALAASGLRANLPGYQGMIGQSSQNIASLLKGQIPSDVLTQMQQQAAERGILTGSPGSPNANAAYLRALGLTSLGLQQQGEGELTGAIQRTPQAQPFNMSAFLTSPEAQQQYGTAQALYNAAPDPAAAAGANLGATAAGLAAGRGSMGAPAMPYLPSFASPSTTATSPWSTAGAGYDPSQAYQNWDQWAASLPTSATSTGTAMADPYSDTGAPPGTSYDPYTDTSNFDPFASYGGSSYSGGNDMSSYLADQQAAAALGS